MLPQAMATGYIHIGTITGKLNGVIPATTPSGWRIGRGVHAGGDVLAELALQQVGDAAGELDHLDAPGHLAPGVLQHLAVFGGDDPGQVVAVAVGQFPEGEQDAAAGGERRVPPGVERRGRRLDDVIDVLGGGQHHLGRLLTGGRVEHRCGAGVRALQGCIRSASRGDAPRGAVLPLV